jgi:preprotein translocase subunit SecA
MQPQEESFAWFGWQKSIALLGLEELKPLVAAAFERGFIDPTVTDYRQFLDDLRLAQTSEDIVTLLADRHIAPLENAIEELSKWHAFSEERKRENALHAGRTAFPLAWDMPQPVTNPLRGVGRNDSCPCGSGKKFKKCCLH